jgi:signal transduction histidine kinase/ActR/RegA family two-component response regulator
MVALLASAGDFEAAVQLEQLWNALRTKHEFSLFCAYSLSSFSGQSSAALIDLCGQHSRVVPAESYSSVSNEEERLRAIVVLQQKALALEAEIADREKAEVALRSLSHDLTKSLLGEQLARSEAEMANRMKDEFVATVSHELRTPLNAIIGWTHVLRTEERNQAARERAVDTIERNARALAQLVEDLLDVSRIITGKLQLNIGEVEVAGIIDAAIESIQPAATSKEIQVSVTLDPEVRRISGDAGRLQQIVWNLLSNAIKFTPPKGRVEVALQRRANDVRITVSDSGKGIDPTFLPFIFERFRQADASTTRKFGGLGLGLSIVRHLVELHGGTVEGHSEGEGKGATFTITLPNSIQIVPAKRTGSPPRVGTDDVTSGSIADRKILLVDQDEGALRTLAGALAAHGARVEVARSARNAIEVLEHFHPEVIVSGLAMPEHYQYSLIQMIRAQKMGERKMAQAIALTGLVRVQDPAHATAAGFNMVLPKPVQPNDLITAISNLMASAEESVE